jgi:hypothetical protein
VEAVAEVSFPPLTFAALQGNVEALSLINGTYLANSPQGCFVAPGCIGEDC